MVEPPVKLHWHFFVSITLTCFSVSSTEIILLLLYISVDTFGELFFLSKCPFSLWSIKREKERETISRKNGYFVWFSMEPHSISLQNHTMARWLCCHLVHPFPNQCFNRNTTFCLSHCAIHLQELLTVSGFCQDRVLSALLFSGSPHMVSESFFFSEWERWMLS